ncbi:MAG: hypothetical protein ACQKBY_04095 [Verrucomicrobiales bacterium]
MLKKIILLAIVLTIGNGISSAHQDTPLELKEGVLMGLPKPFQPARFNLKKKILTIGGKDLQLPLVLKRLFPDTREEGVFGEPHKKEGIPYDLSFYASWYHGPSILPPYLQIRIVPKDRDFRFEILVDIQNLKFLGAKMVVSLSPNDYQHIPIEIDGPDRSPPIDLDWKSAIGTWKCGTLVVVISKDAISAKDGGDAVNYPNGSISPVRPGEMLLQMPDGDNEQFSFVRAGDILNLYLARGGLELVRVGSDTDKLYEQLEKDAEQGAAPKP